MVPNRQLRRRALLLARAAPANFSASQQPTALSLSAFVEHLAGGTVNVLVNVADDIEDTFDESQRVDLRVDGRWTTIRTNARFDINPAQPGKALASHRSGPPPTTTRRSLGSST